MNKSQLFEQIKQKQSFLCVGLDTDINKIPQELLAMEDPVFEFNKQIINKTAQYAVAYKPNTAFYEVYGTKGWLSLERTIQYIHNNYPEIFVIADAKRGDIGNTSANYAKAFFNTLKENNLEVKETIVPVSARFIANKSSWKFKSEAINRLVSELAKQVEG